MIAKIFAGVLRHVLTVVGGGLVSDGWMSGDELNTAIGALIALVGIGWSVWQKSKTRTSDGGEFNPKAKVEKPLPMSAADRPAPPSRPGNRGGLDKGFARPGLLFAIMLLFAFFCLGMAFARASDPDGRGERAGFRTSGIPGTCGGRPYGDWLQVSSELHVPGYHRPFLVRLADSISPWGEVGADKAKLRLDSQGADVAGGWKDSERPTISDFAPDRFALGASGGAQFWSFAQW